MTENLTSLFADFGIPASCAGKGLSGLALFDMPDVSSFGGDFSSTEDAVTIQRSQFSTLAEADTLVVNNVSYAVRRVVKIDDGVLLRVELSPL